MPARPKTVQGNAAACQFFRDHGKPETSPCKSRIFRKTSHLDGTFFRALAFIDRMRHILFGDIRFICRIVNDHRTFLERKIHPFLQLVFFHRCPGRVIRTADIDEIRRLGRKLRHKIIFRRTRHIDHIRPALFFCYIFAGPARHRVCIDIYRINRITNSDSIILCKDIPDISGIALRAVAHKYFINGNIRSPRFVVVFYDRAP